MGGVQTTGSLSIFRCYDLTQGKPGCGLLPKKSSKWSQLEISVNMCIWLINATFSLCFQKSKSTIETWVKSRKDFWKWKKMGQFPPPVMLTFKSPFSMLWPGHLSLRTSIWASFLAFWRKGELKSHSADGTPSIKRFTGESKPWAFLVSLRESDWRCRERTCKKITVAFILISEPSQRYFCFAQTLIMFGDKEHCVDNN